MKANFSMSIVRDKDYKALFNMPLISSTPTNGLMRDKFQQSVKMSTYLVAFIVCDFDSITNKTKAGTNVGTCTMEYEMDIGLLIHVLDDYI